MSYREAYREANEAVSERYELVMERIEQIRNKPDVEKKYDHYFRRAAGVLRFADEILQRSLEQKLALRSLNECKIWNNNMYMELLPENYGASFANPTYTASHLGEPFGQMLCFLYTELRSAYAYAFEGRKSDITILCELFVEIYNCFEDESGADEKEVRQIIYWFFHDYSEVFVEQSVRDMVDPSLDFFTEIVMESDLTDLRYLYQYGEYIGCNEVAAAKTLNAMTPEQIQSMADTYTEGYRIGFEVTGKDLSKKKTVDIRYPIGYERMVRAAIRNFEKMGLRPIISRNSINSMTNRGNGVKGAYSTSPNRQFDYDHKSDRAMYLDKAFVERRLEVLRTSYEAYKELAAVYAGPAVIEVFGEEPFAPAAKSECLSYSKAQQELNVYNANQAGQITNQYIKGEERSFTIIAYPSFAIGMQYDAIFAKTVEINTLDYMLYRDMQQKLIDVLDKADYVHVLGKGENQTDIRVKIHPLSDPAKQTAFENCVADVNIPVGEVFTSPVLEGTNGRLHVTKVYLNDLKYTNLSLTFQDGKVTDYTCDNFDSEEENKKFIHENLLKHHDTLPLGEFAIGTNTTAYRMAKDFQIEDRLPILIAEKTGPHFAVGDTCYSHAEDTPVYNPDGKEIIARDNSVSLLRKTDPSKAYVNCHTDITIPFDELGSITAVAADGSRYPIIEDGKFVVEGTEQLNEPLQ